MKTIYQEEKMKKNNKKNDFAKGFLTSILVGAIPLGIMGFDRSGLNDYAKGDFNKKDSHKIVQIDKTRQEIESYYNKIEDYISKNIKYLDDTQTKTSDKLENNYSEVIQSDKDYTYKLAQVIYGEAANQNEKARRMVAKVALNRAGRKGYPSTLEKVLSQNNAFSCTGADVNKTWKQAIGKLPMNEYEKKVFNDCINDAKYVLEGNKIGVKNEDDIVAYHDARVWYSKLRDSKKHGFYWKKLNHVGRYGNLEFYTEKK